ncbi:unnamed protein product [Caenorhabditis brenneri]
MFIVHPIRLTSFTKYSTTRQTRTTDRQPLWENPILFRLSRWFGHRVDRREQFKPPSSYQQAEQQEGHRQVKEFKRFGQGQRAVWSGGHESSSLGRRLVGGGTCNVCKRTIADFAADNFNNSIVNRSENAMKHHPDLNARQKRVQRRRSLRGKVSSRRSEYGKEAPLVWIYGEGFSKCFVKRFRQSFFVVSTDFVKNSSHSKVKVINNSSSRVEERRIHSNHVKFFGISTTSSAGNTSSHNWSSEQRNKSTHGDNSSSSSQQHQSFRHFYVKSRRIDRKALVSAESTNRQEQGSG